MVWKLAPEGARQSFASQGAVGSLLTLIEHTTTVIRCDKKDDTRQHQKENVNDSGNTNNAA